MNKKLVGLVSGILFGLGLAVSQMVNPQKVLGFLDIFGRWDPSLALVMAGGLAVTTLLFQLVLKQKRPLFGTKFHLPTNFHVDRQLVLGSALFGIGWGLAGYCPGPAIAALLTLRAEPFIFFVALVAGSLAYKSFSERVWK